MKLLDIFRRAVPVVQEPTEAELRKLLIVALSAELAQYPAAVKLLREVLDGIPAPTVPPV